MSQPSQFLTRNRYRLLAVIRGEPRIAISFPGVLCWLQINERDPVGLLLSPEEFNDFVADFGMGPCSPQGTDYESVPMRATTGGRSRARERARGAQAAAAIDTQRLIAWVEQSGLPAHTVMARLFWDELPDMEGHLAWLCSPETTDEEIVAWLIRPKGAENDSD